MTTEIGEVIRWNANFVRSLAQSVLDRAKMIRSSLAPVATETSVISVTKSTKKASRASSKRKTKSATQTRSKRPNRRRAHRREA